MAAQPSSLNARLLFQHFESLADTPDAVPKLTSVLAMRQLHVSLWDLTKESKINKHFDKFRQEMLPGQR